MKNGGVPKWLQAKRALAAEKAPPKEEPAVEITIRKKGTFGPATVFDMDGAIEVRKGLEVIARVTVLGENVDDQAIHGLAREFVAGGAARVLKLPVLFTKGADPAPRKPTAAETLENAAKRPITLKPAEIKTLSETGAVVIDRKIAAGNGFPFALHSILWVREAWDVDDAGFWDGMTEPPDEGALPTRYRADLDKKGAEKFRGAASMPRSRSRFRVFVSSLSCPGTAEEDRTDTIGIVLVSRLDGKTEGLEKAAALVATELKSATEGAVPHTSGLAFEVERDKPLIAFAETDLGKLVTDGDGLPVDSFEKPDDRSQEAGIGSEGSTTQAAGDPPLEGAVPAVAGDVAVFGEE